jgi:hypothetical protein
MVVATMRAVGTAAAAPPKLDTAKIEELTGLKGKLDEDMTGEEPRVLFLHYWGIGRSEDLAKGVHAALVATHVAQ